MPVIRPSPSTFSIVERTLSEGSAGISVHPLAEPGVLPESLATSSSVMVQKTVLQRLAPPIPNGSDANVSCFRAGVNDVDAEPRVPDRVVARAAQELVGRRRRGAEQLRQS